jgi:integrase/recombinase XerD
MQKATQTYQERNQQLVGEFLGSLPSLSKRRVDKYKYRMGKISRNLGKSFDSVTKEELRRYVEEINSSPDFKDWTKQDYRIFLKKFFRWLHDSEFVAWIRIGRVKASVSVEDILSGAELEMIRRACNNLRDKTLIETAYEGAFRPHELLGLKKSSVAFDDYGAKISIEKGKTGPRSIRVVNAAPLLAEWMEHHPLKAKDAPLWVDMSNDTTYQPLKWLGISKLVGRLAKRAGVEKHVKPYLFRHTRLTELSNALTEAQLCMFAGWEQGSDMPRNYVHLSGRDVDDALLRSYGLIKPKEERELKTPRKCVRCGTLCGSDAETCHRCGMALTLQAAMKKDDELAQMRKDLDISNQKQDRILELLREGVKVDPQLLDLRSSDSGAAPIQG